MKTQATDKLPEIEWEVDHLDRIYDDIDERMEVFGAAGESADGREWNGSAYYFADTFEDIQDIEEV